MTETLTAPTVTGPTVTAPSVTTPSVSWRTSQLGLWVATDAQGTPLGIVTEKWVHGFVATGRTGKNLGSYTSLDEAQVALENSLPA